MTASVDQGRVLRLNRAPYGPGPVLYWMSRDQRASDNWALIYAAEMAGASGSPLAVTFCLVDEFLGATPEHYSFMLEGLAGVEAALGELNVPFFALRGDPVERVSSLARDLDAGVVVTDFDPLKPKRAWKTGLARRLDVSFYEVDAHNVVPCREASHRREYAAYTIRRKIDALLPRYLTEYPRLPKQRPEWRGMARGKGIERLHASGGPARNVAGAVPAGEAAALDALDRFVEDGLASYERASMDPNAETSRLSPYLHFGQLSAQRVALAVSGSTAPDAAKAAFLEQLIVRRELSDNFCLNSDYESFAAFPDWARATLDAHRGDAREYRYTAEQLEEAATHDPLWNAAQSRMVRTGYMQNYMRMYWAKKILEWSGSPEEALATAIYLNDRYELDGRDPNGYTGIAWSIGGVHDRAWQERHVFGKVRYMSYEGCLRKFDVDRYIGDSISP